MAQKKPLGSQLDIQDVANEIANDATAIGSIATGVTTDAGAIATLDADYLRRDGGAGSPLPNTDEALVFDGAKWIATSIANSFEGRTGAIVATAGDYLASEITYTPSGSPISIAAVDVQSAIEELDAEKAAIASPVFTGVPQLPVYTIATLPTVVEGGMIYVSDATAAGSPAPTGTQCFGRTSGSPAEWIDATTGLAVV